MDEDEVEAHMEWHKLEEANMAEQPGTVNSSNTREGEYIRGIMTELHISQFGYILRYFLNI